MSSSSMRMLRRRMAAASSGSHGVSAGLAGKRRNRMRRGRRGFVGHVVVMPRPPIQPVPHRASDPDTAPVEVAVVIELRPAG